MTALPLASLLGPLLVFLGLALVQALLARRAHRATRDAILELRGAMKRSFQIHHASLETLAKMIRAQTGDRVSIELPHAPEFMAASSATVAPVLSGPSKREDLDGAAPMTSGATHAPAPMPATSVDEPPKPADGAAPMASGATHAPAPMPATPVDEPRKSQRPTIAMGEPETSRPTVAFAAGRRGMGATREAIEAAAQSRTRPKSPATAQAGDDEFTAIMERPPAPLRPPSARVTPTRISAGTPSQPEPRGE